MDLTQVKDWTWLVVTLGGVILGGIVFVSKLYYEVMKNRELRKEDKEELLKEFNRITERVDKVEKENSQTLSVLTDIKVQLSAIETTLKLFLKTK
jgi:hypothetical protein